jgi:low affinity Fe/Cu permease
MDLYAFEVGSFWPAICEMALVPFNSKRMGIKGKKVMRPTKSTSWFTCFAKWAARATGRPVTFVIAVVIVLIWAVTGPIFGFSDTWQLVINTGTTIVTFLMVFLIQNTQNRDTEALQVKLDELIRAMKGAHNALLDLEELDEEQLDRIRADYEKLAKEARKELQQGMVDTNVPDVESKNTALQ